MNDRPGTLFHFSFAVSDGCGNAIEFKGLRNITDVYAVEEREIAKA